MPDLSIKNVPEQVVAKLRQRAADDHRSLQGELLNLVCRYTEEDGRESMRNDHEAEPSGWLSIDAIAAELKTSRRKGVPLAVDIVRRERDAR